MMHKHQATAFGLIAIGLWSLLALFTVGSSPVPPLQLNAMCFAIATIIGFAWTWRTGGLGDLRTISWKVYAFGTTGLFGYHLFYFSALRLAPAAEAGLIAYLWPLLIVLFSGLLPDERLRIGHLVGALVGFSGAALIIARSGLTLDANALPGYGLALLCALTWSSYSVLSRRLGDVPTNSVSVFCALTAILSLVAHLSIEDTIWPSTGLTWVSILALGVGPVGLAFYVWDLGVKRGDIQFLGAASYAAPLLSTLLLITFGVAAPSWGLLAGAILITAGAALAARASAKSD